MDKMMVGWSVAEHKAVGAVLSSLTMVFLAESTVANGRVLSYLFAHSDINCCLMHSSRIFIMQPLKLYLHLVKITRLWYA